MRVELLIGWQPGKMVQWSAGQRFIGSVDNCHPRAQTQPQIMFGASRSVASSYLIRLKRVENNLKKNSRASSAAEKETVRQFWPCHKNFKYFFLRNSLTFSDENYVLVYSENFHYIQEPYSNIQRQCKVLLLILELRKVRLTQRGWNQKRVYEALCCDRLKVTSQLLSFQSQNLSLV